ncbi:MAG: hypothetical protein R2681_07685 [Pyrinomonadaceae bacterium]
MRKRQLVFVIILALTGSFSVRSAAQTAVLDDAKISTESVSADEKHEHPPGFKSDGCTAYPDGNYRECCEAHDLDYFKGGSFSERHDSDKRLYRCVKAKGGWKNKINAPLMYLGVRVFGTAWLPTPFRWGFGKKKIKRAKEQAEREAAAESSQSKTSPADKKSSTDSDSKTGDN